MAQGYNLTPDYATVSCIPEPSAKAVQNKNN